MPPHSLSSKSGHSQPCPAIPCGLERADLRDASRGANGSFPRPPEQSTNRTDRIPTAHQHIEDMLQLRQAEVPYNHPLLRYSHYLEESLVRPDPNQSLFCFILTSSTKDSKCRRVLCSCRQYTNTRRPESTIVVIRVVN